MTRLLCPDCDQRPCVCLPCMVAVIPSEAELGPQRFCGRCALWWPFTAEFWQAVRLGRSWVCRACQREHNRR
jgi:hypothetical protein